MCSASPGCNIPHKDTVQLTGGARNFIVNPLARHNETVCAVCLVPSDCLPLLLSQNKQPCAERTLPYFLFQFGPTNRPTPKEIQQNMGTDITIMHLVQTSCTDNHVLPAKIMYMQHTSMSHADLCMHHIHASHHIHYIHTEMICFSLSVFLSICFSVPKTSGSSSAVQLKSHPRR